MTEVSRIYEGMFLLDAGQTDFEKATEPIKIILERRDAEILALKPWDERRLAYEIQDRKRGQYVLTYFRVNASQISEMEHDCQLDERILRSMFIRCDKNVDDKINAETPALAGKRRAAEADAARTARTEAEAKAKAEQQAEQTDEVAEAVEAPATDAPAESPAEAPATDAPAESPAEAPATDAPAESPAEAPATDAPAESPPDAEEQAAADEGAEENETKSD